MKTRVQGMLRGAVVILAALGAAEATFAAAGRTPGAASVSQTGEASYAIPILTPPGSQGMAPELALVYGHRNGESVAGVGWGISGLSVIRRCNKTWAQDGSPDGVYLTTADRFCLDGNQMKLVSGSYGVAGSTYRTEIDTFARITAMSTAGNGPAWFKVEQANGLIYEYGNSIDSRIESLATGYTTTARAWALSSIRDRAGNTITFSYQEDGAPNGDYRILSVDYTSNASQSLSALYRVAFTYETQPATDIDSEYLAGGRIDDLKRLTQVEVTHNPTSTRVRRYTLSYASAPVTGRSRVTSIQECAGPVPDCFPATTFTYQNGTQGFGSMVSAGTVNGPLAIDLNGDSRTDVVYSTTATSGSGYWAYRLANGSGGYDAAVTSPIGNHNFSQAVAIDYNADGLDDILVPCSSNTTWCVIQGSTTGLQAPINTAAPSTTTSKAIAIDWNGDGLDDLFWIEGVYARVRLRVWGAAFATTATVVRSDVSAGNNLGEQSRSRRRGLDVNGDGKPDFVYLQASGYPPSLKYYVSLGGSSSVWFLSSVLGGNARAVDINGDGYSDVAYGINNTGVLYWRFSTGASFAPFVTGPSLVNYNIDRALGFDYDGDGFEDLVLPNTSVNRWYWLRSTGTGFVAAFADTGIATGSATSSFLVDANGDGLDDLGFVTSASEYRHLPHAGVQADLLVTATDGYGDSTTFAYGGNGTCIAQDYPPPPFPYQRYSGPLTAACTLTASNGIGGTYQKSFSYYNLDHHLQGRGLTGFQRRYITDTRDTIGLMDAYKTEFPYIGLRYYFISRHDNWANNIVEAHATAVPALQFGSGNETRYFPYVSQLVTKDFGVGGGYDNTLIRTATTNNTVDATSGIVIDSTTTTVEASGANGVQPGASYVQRVYHPAIDHNTGSWCLGRPTQTQFIRSHNQPYGTPITRTVHRTWDTATYCRLTQDVTEPWSGTYRVTRDLGYDGFGNVNAETVTGIGLAARTTQVNWGTSGQFPNAVTNALNHTTSLGWDYALGVKTSERDPNSTDSNPIVTSWQYDAFGRPTRETRPDGTYTTMARAACDAASNYCGDTRLRMHNSVVDYSSAGCHFSA